MTPFKGTNKITSPFGPRTSPITGKQEQHKGEDIVASGTGDAWAVRECTGGTVLRVSSDQWRGNYVDVETSPGVFERYQHMKVIYVTVGQKVPQGTVLGIAGNSGDCAGTARPDNEYMAGRHLHFEVQKNGVAVNPEQWSGVPNKNGTYPGNDSMDGVPAPEGDYLLIGPMSGGDKAALTKQAQALGLPVKVTDGSGEACDHTLAVSYVKQMQAGARQTIEAGDLALKDLGV